MTTALAVTTPDQCIREYCSNEAKTCREDPKCIATLQDCERSCGNDTSCWTNCLAQKGNAPASAFWKCILDHNCFNNTSTISAKNVEDPTECIKEKCPTQYAAC